MSEGAFMLLPCLTSLVYREHEGLAYLITAVLTFLLGFLLNFRKPKNTNIYIKEGRMPDLLVSGINHGSNASAASIYSGTLGAATEEDLKRLNALYADYRQKKRK